MKVHLVIISVLYITLGLSVFLMKNKPTYDKSLIISDTLDNKVNTKNDLTKKYNITKLNLSIDNTVILFTEINALSVNKAINELMMLRNDSDQLFLLIDSPGGSVVDGAKLISFIETSDVPITTVCIGVCASMAAHIHQSGFKRLMTDHSILMFHPASAGTQGTVDNMLTYINMLKTYVDRFDAAVSKRSGIDYKEFKLKVLENYWVEARDALDVKLADKLVVLNIEMPEIKLKIEEQLKKKVNNDKANIPYINDVH